MARSGNQKLKMFYLAKIMLEKTDDEHGLTMPQIISALKAYGVTAERKSLYSDIEDLTDFCGIEIYTDKKGRETLYHVGARQFELAEAKLLIDAIQSSKFITEKKSRDLIRKIQGFVSENQARQLQRQVFITDRAKTMNESVYYNVDDIHTAINNNRKIRFKYGKWNVQKKLELRHGGAWFVVSPWSLTWDDENYYLIAYDDMDQKIKHYRVDKMVKITVCDEERDGKDVAKNLDLAAYSKATFGMYGGEQAKVTIEFPNPLCGVFIDRFGKEIILRKVTEERSSTQVQVAVSPQFFGWVFSLGKDVRVTGPAEVVEKMKEFGEAFIQNYE